MRQDLDDEDLRAICQVTGDWGGTPWGDAILRLLHERDVARQSLSQSEDFIKSRELQMRGMVRRREALTPERTKAFADGLAEAAVIIQQRRRDG